jgi:hypothetical protein
MEREPSESFDWEDSTAVGVTRGLEELRDALTSDEEDEHLVRRHRGVIVLSVLVGAFWLGIAGMFAAVTREGPIAEHVLAFEPERVAATAAIELGPNEWPLIAIAPRNVQFFKSKKAAPAARPSKKRAHPR